MFNGPKLNHFGVLDVSFSVTSPEQHYKRFFSKLNVGDCFIYSMAFDYKEVVEIARRNGFVLKYITSDMPEHKGTGCMGMKIIGKVEEELPSLDSEVIFKMLKIERYKRMWS